MAILGSAWPMSRIPRQHPEDVCDVVDIASKFSFSEELNSYITARDLVLTFKAFRELPLL